MKKYLLSLLASAILLSGCTRDMISQPQNLIGDGNVISREIPIADYHTIVAEIPVEVHYTSSPGKPYLRITADSNVIEALNPHVKHGVLVLSRHWPWNVVEECIVASHCVVHTNSHNLQGFGSEALNLGLLAHDLKHKSSFELHQKFFLNASPLQFSVDGENLQCVESSGGIFIGSSGAKLDVVKRDGKVRLDFVYDTVTANDITARCFAMGDHSKPAISPDELDLYLNGSDVLIEDLDEAMADLQGAFDELDADMHIQ